MNEEKLLNFASIENDYMQCGSSNTTSVSPGSRQGGPDISNPQCKSNLPRSLSFHNIKESSSLQLGGTISGEGNCSICLMLNEKQDSKICKTHFKSDSCVRQLNHIFLNEINRTITLGKWEDPFEPKHVYKEPTFSPRVDKAMKYLSTFKELREPPKSPITNIMEDRQRSAPAALSSLPLLAQPKKKIKQKRININEKKSHKDLIAMTQRLSELADYIDNKHSFNSVSTNSSFKRSPKKYKKPSPKGRRVTWDELNTKAEYFESNVGKNTRTRKATYNFGPGYEIKEALDEKEDEDGLKINLNLCPAFEDDIDDINHLAAPKTCISKMHYYDSPSSPVKTDASKSPSFKTKKKKRKVRKMTTTEYSNVFKRISSPLDKKSDCSQDYKEQTKNFKKFSWHIGASSNVDKISNLSPCGYEYSDDSPPFRAERISKGSSDNSNKLSIPTENMLDYIHRLKDLEKNME